VIKIIYMGQQEGRKMFQVTTPDNQRADRSACLR